MDVLEGIAKSFSSEERKEAHELEEKKEHLIKAIVAEKTNMEMNFVRLSKIINEIRQKKYWLLTSYKNFGEYLANCEDKFGVGHSQLYVGMKIVRNLPDIPDEELVAMGITKAGVLSKYVEQSGQMVPDDILDTAKTKKADELQAMVNSRLHNVLPENGTWLNFGGFFCSEDEKKEIQQALMVAGNVDPVVPNNIPNWQQLKEKTLRLCREFLGTYSG
jgi:hypothetical protein